ncbi:MAG TPA: hypothetical protein VJ957_08620 [Longimicrobiales bacterium]|nr:hypothetical protein [Longimicrobiales bacterium]
MKHWILACVLVAAAAAPLRAQGPPRRSLAGYFMMGGSLLKVDDLNAQLTQRAYAAFPDRFISLGGGVHYVVNQAVVAGEAHALVAERASSSNGTFSSSLGGGLATLGVGYLIYEGDNLDIYPLIGAGWGSMTLDLTERSAPTFGDVLDNPQRGAHMRNSGFVVSFSLGGDYVFDAGGANDHRKGFLLGIRAGYAYAPVQNDWRLANIDLTSGPAMNVTGPFIRVMLGLGGRGRKLFGDP